MKMTQSEFIDVRFTVAISYAVMFLMQMMIISALPGTVPVHARSQIPETEVTQNAKDTDQDDDATNTTEAATNQTIASAQPVSKAAVPEPTPSAAKPVGNNIAGQFSLKGVMKGPRDSTVMVYTGVRTYSIHSGETLSMDTASGPVKVSLVQVSDNAATLDIGGTTNALSLR